MQVEQLMTKEVRTCRPLDTLNQAAQIFWENDCGCAPVVDHNSKVVGIITDRDALMSAYMTVVPLTTQTYVGAVSLSLQDERLE